MGFGSQDRSNIRNTESRIWPTDAYIGSEGSFQMEGVSRETHESSRWSPKDGLRYILKDHYFSTTGVLMATPSVRRAQLFGTDIGRS
jgi:hypothetical protein